VLLDRQMLRLQATSSPSGSWSAGRGPQEAGAPFNLDSPKQLCTILFEKMQLPVLRKTPTGQPSTAEDVLEELAASYPLPKLILEHRGLSKLKSTYTDKLPEQINAKTGVCTPAITRRSPPRAAELAGSEPAEHSDPHPEAAHPPGVRRAAGHVLLAADYSQIELRIMAHLSGDEGLLRAFASDATSTRPPRRVFGTPLEQVSADQRRSAKAVNFGLIYGMSAFGLAKQLGIPRGTAQEYIDLYFARYPV
jgi:DNA polymerase-1